MRKSYVLLLFVVMLVVAGCAGPNRQVTGSLDTGSEGASASSGVSESQTAENRDQLPSDQASREMKPISIGITQIVEHPSLDAIREGIIKALNDAGYESGKNLTIDFENAQGDRTIATDIAHKFAGKNLDLVIAITTPSAQAIKEVIQDKPIVFAAVSDPLAAGLVDDLTHPGGKITGSSDQTPIDQEIALILKVLPEAKTIGVVYNSGEVNAEAQLKQAEKAAAAKGLKIIQRGISQGSEVPLAVDALGPQVDAFLTLNDNLVVGAMDQYLERANNLKKPVFASDPDSVDKGAVATYGIDQYKLGQRTGELVVRVLNGEDPGTIPVLIVQDTFLKVNETALKALGLDLSEALQQELAAQNQGKKE